MPAASGAGRDMPPVRRVWNGVNLFCGFGREENGHHAALKFGLAFEGGGIGALLGEPEEQITSKIGMGHFTSPKADGYFDAVAVGKEFLRVFQFGVKIAHVDAGGHADFFDFDDPLVFPGFFFPFALFKAELAVVHELADRRDRLRGNFNQVEALLIRDAERLHGRHNAELFAVGADQPDFPVTDILIQFMHMLSYGRNASFLMPDAVPVGSTAAENNKTQTQESVRGGGTRL